MNITFLGSRGEIEEKAPRHTKHSGILINGQILIDVGEPEYRDRKPGLILFTHLHPDHAYFVREKETFIADAPVYAPESSELIPNLSIIEEPFSFSGYKIIPVPTIHSLKVKSTGYIIIYEQCKVMYTGDMAWIEKKYHHHFEGLDLVISDGSFLRKGGMIRRDKESGKIYGHTGIPDIIRMFADYTPEIAFTHFGKWFMDDVPLARKKLKEITPDKIKLVTAHDGKEIEVC